MTLSQLLERAACRHPDSEAVIDGATRWSYAELLARSDRLAGGLVGLGVKPGDRVLLALRNRAEHVLAWWALQRLGAVATSVNFRLAAAEMAYVLGDCGARVALFERASAPAVLEVGRGMDARLVYVGDDALAGTTALAALDATPPATGVVPGDLSIILYTSGTTGRPKGVPRSHANGGAGALAHVIQCGYTWGERTLGVMPLYHTMGVHALLSMAAVNGCFVCEPEWSPAAALRAIAAERISALYLIPTLFYDLVHAPELPGSDVRSVRKLAYAGAPMRAPLSEACLQAFRPDVFVNHYGSTEIYTFSVRAVVHEKPGCAGRAGIHSTLRVVAARAERRVDPDEVVPVGESGEIIVSLDSPEAFAGYWNRPDADARALRGGWYFTGDVGHFDADGELWVDGRVDDMIISGGENIHPVEVEEVLARHPQVRDVAVLGEPDERWGQRVVAFVVPAAPGLTAEALDRHCRQGGVLAPFKRPRRVVFVEAIPKTASGKILRRLLREGHGTEMRS